LTGLAAPEQWVIERTFAWLNQFRRFRVRYEKRADIHEGLMLLGCVLICSNFYAAPEMHLIHSYHNAAPPPDSRTSP
jgi:hypothetical protein